MDWIQCNHCGIKPNQTKLYLTACGHVFCQNCTKAAFNSQCYLCKKPLKVDEINKNLRPDLMELFKDPRQLASDLVNELKQVVAFQAKQREIYVKCKNAEAKKDTERFAEARSKHVEKTQEIEKRKKAFLEDNVKLKNAKEEKNQLMARLKELREQPSQNLSVNKRRSNTRTEPPFSKLSRTGPPSVMRKASHEFSLNLRDQSTSKILTSTPLSNIDYSRRDHRNRLFGAGLEHPSPILRQ